jgi:serine phosphatase RsbU (regulator of sigma subunit)
VSRFLLLLLTFLFASRLPAQDKSSVELQRELKAATHDTTRISILLALVDAIPVDSVWLPYNDSAVAIAERHLADRSEPLRKYYMTGRANAMGNRGFWCNAQGNFVGGLDSYHDALKLYEELNDSVGIARSLNNIAYVHHNMADFPLAAEYYEKSMNITRALGDTASVLITMGNIASVKSFMHDTDGAVSIYREIVLKPNKDSLGAGRVNAMANLGMIYLDRHQLDSAYYFLIGSKSIRELNGDKRGMCLTYLSLSRYWLVMKGMDSARYYVNTAHALATEIGSNDLLKRSTDGLYRYFRAAGNYKDALHYYELHIALRDTIFNQDVKTATIRKNISYQYEKQKIADSLEAANRDKMTQLELAESEAQLNQANTQRFALIVIAVLVAIVAFVIFNRYRDTQRKNTIIEAQKSEVEFQKSLVDQKNSEILDSINYARRLQNAILATDNEIQKSLPESFILYLPKDIVAGDFYFFETTSDSVFIAAADCTGHGVPGALVSVVCANALTRAVKEFNLTQPGKILDKVNELVQETFSRSESSIHDGMDISLLRIPSKRGDKFACEWAGALNSLVYFMDGALHEKKGDKQPVGKFEGTKAFITHTIEMKKGVFISLFTDGYPDQFGGPKGKKFKYNRLKELLGTLSDQDASRQKSVLHKTFDEWRGTLDQVDDVCVIGVRL